MQLNIAPDFIYSDKLNITGSIPSSEHIFSNDEILNNNNRVEGGCYW